MEDKTESKGTERLFHYFECIGLCFMLYQLGILALIQSWTIG